MIRQKLVSPASAVFPPFEKAEIEGTFRSFRIKAFVDSQNSYGAMLRTDFEVVVRREGEDSWRLEWIDWREK